MKPKHTKKTLKILAWLESCHENLNELLESYRYLQPDGEALTKETIEKISQLEADNTLACHKEETMKRRHHDIKHEIKTKKVIAPF